MPGRTVVLAQPIVDLASGESHGHELTLRPPADDGRLLIARAIEFARNGHRVAVDICAASLDDADLAAWIQRAVVGAEIDPALLTFELPEPALTTNAAVAAAVVQCVHAMGCSVTIDHCGKGHAGLGYLKRLPVDCLKIDAQFIAELRPASADEQLVRALVYLARGLGMNTAADGVSDATALAVLEDLGVDQAQGAWFGAPSALADSVAAPLVAVVAADDR